jgi:hypothetical protein
VQTYFQYSRVARAARMTAVPPECLKRVGLLHAWSALGKSPLGAHNIILAHTLYARIRHLKLLSQDAHYIQKHEWIIDALNTSTHVSGSLLSSYFA